MNENTVTRSELQYIKNIEKLEQLTEKQEAKLVSQEAALSLNTKEIESLKLTLAEKDNEIEILKQSFTGKEKEIAKLNAELEEAHTHCVEHQNANDELANHVEELHSKMMTDEDYQLFLGAKADVIFSTLYEQKRTFSMEELKENNFPMEIFEISKEGVQTTNFLLSKLNENEYKLSKN